MPRSTVGSLQEIAVAMPVSDLTGKRRLYAAFIFFSRMLTGLVYRPQSGHAVRIALGDVLLCSIYYHATQKGFTCRALRVRSERSTMLQRGQTDKSPRICGRDDRTSKKNTLTG